MRNPAENLDTCRTAWWAVQGMKSSPCSWSKLGGSDLGRVYVGASRESRHYLFARCRARPDDGVSGPRCPSTSDAPHSYPARGEWWLLLLLLLSLLLSLLILYRL